MAINPQFKLKDKSATTLTSIRLQFYLDNKRFLYSLGSDKRIHPELWNVRTMRPISKRSQDCQDESERNRHKYLIDKYKKKYPFIDTELVNIDTRISNVITETRKFFSLKEEQNKTIDLNELKNHLDGCFNAVKHEEQKTEMKFLNSYADSFIKDITNGSRTYTTAKGENRRYGTGTIKTYKNWLKTLREYETKHFKRLRFEDITIEFEKTYLKYFQDKNCTTNTTGKHIKTLKKIMRSAQEEGLHNNTEYDRFRVLKADTTEIYLTKNELELLYRCDLSDKLHHELCRDIFLIGCWTALRYSDFSRIKPHHIIERNGHMFIEIITQKTNTKVIIPVNPLLRIILEKYNYQVPKTYEQKMNKYIKEIAKELEINDIVEVQTNRGARLIYKNLPKYELIKTHTARRTGATLMYKSGVPSLDIMKITGHSTEKNLLKYIRVTKEETAERLTMNPFFSGKMNVV